MLYEIKDKYYVLVGNKYINIKMIIKNNDVELIPNQSEFIERGINVKAKEVSFDDTFKKAYINSMSKKNNKI